MNSRPWKQARYAESEAHLKVAKTINSDDVQSWDTIYARLSSYYAENSSRLRALQTILTEFVSLLESADQDEHRRPSWWLDAGEVYFCNTSSSLLVYFIYIYIYMLFMCHRIETRSRLC
jgi:hypothetical protein